MWDGSGVRLWRCDQHLRTQTWNADRAPAGAFVDPADIPRGAIRKQYLYTNDVIGRHRTIFGSIRNQTGIDLAPSDFRIPIAPHWRRRIPRRPSRRVALFHPPTVRKEWFAPARNPQPEYMATVLRWLKDDGFAVISVAWEAPGAEFIVGEYPGIDIEYHRGELHYTSILALLEAVDVVVSGPCFLLPAALATKARALFIYGGHIAPDVLVDDMAHDGYFAAVPSTFCDCIRRDHDCQKDIDPNELRAVYESCVSGL